MAFRRRLSLMAMNQELDAGRQSALNSLLQREVEVYWPEEDQWFSGMVIEKGLDPESAEAKLCVDGVGVGWKIRYDDGDEGWMPNLRNNALIRFLGTSVRSKPADTESLQPTVSTINTTFRKHTQATKLPPYVNAEKDWVAQAFGPGSLMTLRKLPEHIQAGAVETHTAGLRRTNIDTTEQQYVEPLHVRKTGYFSQHQHMHSDYSAEHDQLKEAKRHSDAKRLEFCERDFLPTGLDHKQKHEDLFAASTFRHEGDPYEAPRQQAQKMKWIAESKVLHGRFESGGRTRDLSVPTRHLLPAMITKLHNILREDWADSNFAVMVDNEDHILVRFEVHTVVSPRALMGYMNTLARDTSRQLRGSLWFREYRLRVVAEDWGREDGHGGVVFMFQPPWVKTHHLDTFLTLHPEARTPKRSSRVEPLVLPPKTRKSPPASPIGGQGASPDAHHHHHRKQHVHVFRSSSVRTRPSDGPPGRSPHRR